MITTIDGKDGQEFAIDRDDLIAIMNQLSGGGGIEGLSVDAGDIRELLEDDQSHDVTLSFGLEATIRGLDDEDSKAKLLRFFEHTRVSSRLETVLYQALQEEIEAWADGQIDIAALNLNAADID